MTTRRDLGMALADDRHDLYAALAETFGHLDRHRVAAAGRRHQRAVLRRNVEIAKDALGEARDVFKEHRLALPVRAHDRIVKSERQFHNRVETGKRTVARPHFFNEYAAVARAKQMHHA